VGLSGVGKSSIVNRLLGKDAQKIGEERASDARGRHTTTHREMFKTETGVIVIDTPGMREFALVGEDEADLSAFTDVVELAASCQFRDCRHGDEPGCAVQAAVARKELEADRVHSYRLLAKELDEAEKVKERRRPDRQRRPSPKGRRGRQTWDDD
jgi:ribosome biogenesis GTPase